MQSNNSKYLKLENAIKIAYREEQKISVSKQWQDRVMDERHSPSMPKDEFTIWTHKWYNEDGGRSLERELVEMLMPIEI